MYAFLNRLNINEIFPKLKMVQAKKYSCPCCRTALFVEHRMSVVGEIMYIVTCRGCATVDVVSETLKFPYR